MASFPLTAIWWWRLSPLIRFCNFGMAHLPSVMILRRGKIRRCCQLLLHIKHFFLVDIWIIQSSILTAFKLVMNFILRQSVSGSSPYLLYFSSYKCLFVVTFHLIKLALSGAETSFPLQTSGYCYLYRQLLLSSTQNLTSGINKN